jgi:hypothetical protein
MAINRMPRGAFPSPRSKIRSAPAFAERGHLPPTHVKIPAELSFWGNETYGDCVTAEEAFAKACYAPEIFITEDTAINWAERHNVLNSAVISVVLETMITDGFEQIGRTYDNGQCYSVDYTNPAVLQNAILSGPVKVGVSADQLNAVYDHRNGWFATGFHTDKNTDHCISLCGFGSIAFLAQQLKVNVPTSVDGSEWAYLSFSWDSIGIIDRASLTAISTEAWVRQPTTIIRVGKDLAPSV